MEGYRPQRSQVARFPSPSKVTTIIDHCSADKLNAHDRPHRGKHDTLKHKFPKLERNSSSCGSSRTTFEHSFEFELGRSSSILPARNLMKNLLVDEMSKETESRRRSPSVIAKLMGLDRLPSQNGINKQPKRPSDGFHGKIVSAGTGRHRKSCNNLSCRKIARGQLFKDVHEVWESLKGQIEGYASQVPPNRRHSEDEKAFIRQKITHARCHCTDEKRQDSKEFYDAIDMLNSNNQLFLKFLREPDTLFAKHLHDLQVSPQSLCRNVRNLKVSDALNCNINEIGCQAGREETQKNDVSLSCDCQEDLRAHVSHRRTQESGKSIFSPIEVKQATSAAPTKIVLLKPNLGRSTKTTKSSSSSCELWSDAEMHTEKQMQAMHGEADFWGKKRLPIELDFSEHKARKSRALAKEITQHMKRKLGIVSLDVPLSGRGGYTADESSQCMSVNDSFYEVDTTFPTSRTSYCSSFRGKSSSQHYGESYVNIEGKKRLSARLKRTRMSDEIRAEKCTTLREMLTMPDLESRLPSMDGAVAEDGRSDGNVKLAGVGPLGISSEDGWKDGCIRSLSRSTFLPDAYDLVENPESLIKHEGIRAEMFLASKQGATHGRRQTVNRDLSWKEGSSFSVKRSGDKKPHSSHHMSKENVNDMWKVQVGGNGKKNVLAEKESIECQTVILETPICRLGTMNLDSMIETEHEKISLSLNSGDDLLPAAELSADVQVKDDSCSSGLHESTPQNPAAQPESPASYKELDQPSPVSVLEASFLEDLSSGSECFERVSAELQGLRMQLQLLKLESKAYAEGTLLISSDEDEGSTGSTEAERGPTATEPGAWEASYMADVLEELRLEETDPNTFMTTWNSSDCPMGPRLFDKLEKVYAGQASDCSRSDRRLLFDRIKHGIAEIAQRSINPHPWVKVRSGSKTRFQWTDSWFETELSKLLARGEKEEEVKCGIEEMLMDVGMHVDGLGSEVEKMVLDELIAELLTV